MKLNPEAEIYIPDNTTAEIALARTTHLAIGAHQDDLEIMAIDGILTCFRDPQRWFTGVVVTDGSGSPRTGFYADFSNEEMMEIRDQEQKMAAFLGNYSAQIFLRFPSSEVKNRENSAPKEGIQTLIRAARPDIIYTHNLADKHATHVGVSVTVIQALRDLPDEYKPQKVFGCEVWRDLGWMLDDDKVIFDCSQRQNLQEALLGVFDSQISGGKRYDLATMGRRTANATYFASHEIDESQSLSFGMDLTSLVLDAELDIQDFVQAYIDRFSSEVRQLIGGVL